MTDRASTLGWLFARDRDYLHNLFDRECLGPLPPEQVPQAVQGQLGRNFVADRRSLRRSRSLASIPEFRPTLAIITVGTVVEISLAHWVCVVARPAKPNPVRSDTRMAMSPGSLRRF